MHYKIIIVGAGFCGSSVALALHHHFPNWPIAVIEKKQLMIKPNTHPQNSDKFIILTHGSYRLLSELDLLDHTHPLLTPIHQLHISQAKRPGYLSLCRKQWDLPFLGCGIAASSLQHILHKKLKQAADKSPHLSLYEGHLIQNLSLSSSKALLQMQNKTGNLSTLSAELVIAVDGRDSPLRKKMGIQTKYKAYADSLLMGQARLKKPHQNRAYERLLPQGPLAILPKDKESCQFIWTMPHQRARHYETLSDSDYLALLKQAFGLRVPIQSIESRIRISQVLSCTAQETARPGGVLLLGNAAITLHPIGAQGLNLALRDVQALISALKKQQINHSPLGEPAFLRAYVQTRKTDRLNTQKITHTLRHLLGEKPPLGSRTLRGLGLAILNSMPSLSYHLFKNTF